MKIAIHFDNGKDNFCHRWISYCEINSKKYILVNAFENNIIDELSDCTHFLWHWMHYDYQSVLSAKQILFSLEKSKIKVFPDINTCFYYDDKLGQKYLFESLKIDSIPTNIFYSKSKAIEWLEKSDFPFIFKLRNGAGANNVIKVKNYNKGRRLIKKAFSSGFSHKNKILKIKELFLSFRKNLNLLSLIKLFLSPILFLRKNAFPNEKNYILLQEFIPNNNFDLRIIVVGNRACSLKRFNRENDFRASGSGLIDYPNKENSDIECIKLAFQMNKKLKYQAIAFDFLYRNGKPILVEISFGFSIEAYDLCPGYWTSDLKWINGGVLPQNWIIEDLLS